MKQASWIRDLDLMVREERRQVVRYGMLGLCGLALFALFLYATTVPASRREVRGALLSFETIADDSIPLRRRAVVRLDDGRTVQAGVSGHLTLRPGGRVRLSETTTALIGMRRYYIRGVEPARRPRARENVPTVRAAD